ncbi:AAA family ATPase [Micromonospora sonneratiae]|uniref:AAA family ATPase n=1 Tax=Micromonospora sonneratiae TaxID=1184706 RepID=A0ABW3YNC8_9ACTN
MRSADRYVVITGGPGSGKSSLLDTLRRAGFPCVEEAGRQIIRDQTAIGGRGLHTGDARLFAELMLAWEIRSHRQAGAYDGTVFFDRGIPDVVGYHLLHGWDVPPHVSAAADLFRYHPRVFVAPPWPEIYVNDGERGQDFAEAVRTHDAMVAAYTRHGYRPITLPKADPAGRLEFVRRHLV